jgi:organic hydroperoxide reductase OsmC/OhrA
MEKTHLYQLEVQWTGNSGEGTKDYRSYERSHLISAKNKPTLLGSSDPAFRGDAQKWNPEELLLASLSSCHMLWYLHLCSDNKIVVISYKDEPKATMVVEETGAGSFKEASLQPTIVIVDPSQISLAEKFHEEAHKKCFIANSIKFPVKILPSISSPSQS